MIDPRVEEALRHCREYKKRLDRRRRLIRTVMLCPPVLILFWAVILLVGSAAESFGRASGEHVSVGGAAFLASIVVTVFAAGETALEKKAWIEISGRFYGIAAAACAALALSRLFPDCDTLLSALAWYCLIAVFLNLLFKRLYEENQTMKRMRGYPHFDPGRMTEKELRGEKPDGGPLEGLSPEEQIMRDRGDMRY